VMAAVLCLCHGRFVSDCPRLGYRPVRDIAGRTVLDCCLAPHEGLCGLCGAPYACGQRVVEMPPPTWGRPFAHAECPRSVAQ
jgi:hypothetical protein